MRVALMWLADAFNFAFLLACSFVCSLLPKVDKVYLTFLVIASYGSFSLPCSVFNIFNT